jgi:hypothetical protein
MNSIGSLLFVMRYQQIGGNPDMLRVYGEHGEIAFEQPMQPDAATNLVKGGKDRPWFFTGSPYGAKIIAAAWRAKAT